jgi:outer membrane biosynthesis protein TonB
MGESMRSSSPRRRPGRSAWLLVLVLIVSVGLVSPVTAQTVPPGESEAIQAPDPTETPSPTEEPAPTDEPVATEEPAPTKEPPTEEPPTEPTAEPSETPVPTDEPAATETPVSTETPLPTETSEQPEVPGASPTVEDEPEFAAAAVILVAFDQPSYSAVPGSTLTITLTITIDGPTEGGSVVMNAPPFTTFTSLVAGSSGSTTCTAVPVSPPVSQITGLFSATGGGTCTYAITLAINPVVPPGFSTFMSAFTSTLVPSGLVISNVTLTITQPPLNTLTISAIPANPFPGEIVNITVQHLHPATLSGPGSIQGSIPAGTALVPGSATATCSPVCILPPPTSETASSVSAIYGALPALDTTVTLTYQVTILPSTAPGTTITFVGNGMAGLQPTGPAETSITVASPLVAHDQSLTAPFEGSVDGTVTAAGGIPPLSFAVTTDPTRGTLTLDPVTGAFTYSANPGQMGADSFTFTATDSRTPTALTDQGTVTITIGAPAALVAATLTLTVDAGQSASGELAGQVTGGLPPYTFSLLTPPSQGTATVDPDGSFTYTANMDGSGPDSFTYQVTDSQPASTDVGAAATTTGTVTIVIEAAQPVPSPTPTEPGPSPTPTEEPDDGIIGPGDPGDDDGTDHGADDGDDGTGEDPGDGGPVTRLPSTGHGGGTGALSGWSLVLLGVIALGIAAAISSRPRHR